LILSIASIALVTLPARAKVSKPTFNDHSTFIFHLENDIFSGTDKHFTNALKLSWISKDYAKNGDDGSLPGWSRWLVEQTPSTDRQDFMHNLALSLGQNIYTPRDTSTAALIEGEPHPRSAGGTRG
jgi:hypothetical protein